MSRGHTYTDSQATSASTDVESNTTTLLGSPAGSRKISLDEHGPSPDKDVDGEGDTDDEDLPLLAHETTALELAHQLSAADPIVDGVDAPVSSPTSSPPPAVKDAKPQPVSWSQLPKKGQLAILTLARLSEPLTQTSLQSYMFYQLKSFKLPDGSAPSDSTVSRQAGMLAASFSGAQFLTAMMWGRLADSEKMGRKKVILIGLLGTSIGALGFGFSSSFPMAVCFRLMGGVLNGNIGVMRTMISETIREKRFQSRAFLLLPMCFNIGVIIGPLLGGILADPVQSYPGIFGPEGSIGEIWWMKRFPYALPNVVSATFLFCSAMGVTFGLDETLEGLKDRPDYGRRFSKWVARTILRTRPPQQEYNVVGQSENDVEIGSTNKSAASKKTTRRKLPFRRIFTTKVLIMLAAHGLLGMHVGTFQNLWFVFLSTPRYDPAQQPSSSHRHVRSTAPVVHLPKGYHPYFPFTFTGGLALPPPSIGTALAILGVIGISLQLLLYPRLSFKLGTLRSYRYALWLFPLSYTLVPFLATLPSSVPPPNQAGGAAVWLGITFVLAIQVLARTFALPASAILVNNSSPHPSVLGSLHGIAQSVASLMRTMGPMLGGWIYGVGLTRGVVGTAWWCMAGLAVVGAVAGRFVSEGDGHEIWLEGEREEAEAEAEGRKG